MKIAAVTEDGVTISQHFGRAPFYEVLEVEDGAIVGRERRPKLGHAQLVAGPGHHDEHVHAPGQPHGTDPAARSRHAGMVEAISDCDVLLARGMGQGAYQSVRAAGIRPVVTDVRVIDQAVLDLVAGRIVDHVERLH